MKRWALLLAIGLVNISNTGCYTAVWDPNDAVRMQQLVEMSEQLRQTRYDMSRSMLLDTPSNLSPMQLSGVVAPPGPPGFGP